MNTIRITAAALFVLFSFGAVAVSAQGPSSTAEATEVNTAEVVSPAPAVHNWKISVLDRI